MTSLTACGDNERARLVATVLERFMSLDQLPAWPARGVKGTSKRPGVWMLARGCYHANLLWRTADESFVVRIPTAHQFGDALSQLRHEFGVLKVVEGSGLTPKPVALVERGSRWAPFLVESFLAGRPLTYEQDLLQAARSLAVIHSVSVPQRGRGQPTKASHVLVADGLARVSLAVRGDVVAAQLRHMGEELLGRPWQGIGQEALVNTDLHRANFVIGPCCGVVDWEGGRWSDVEWDLAHFLSETTTSWGPGCALRLPPEAVVSFLAEYDQRVGLDSKRELAKQTIALLPFVSFRYLCWLWQAAAERGTGSAPLLEPWGERIARRDLKPAMMRRLTAGRRDVEALLAKRH